MRSLQPVAAAILTAICSGPVQASDQEASLHAGMIKGSIAPGLTVPHNLTLDTSTPMTIKQYAAASEKDACVAAFLREAKQRAMQTVAPEYDRRLQRDGKAAADSWLAKTAREIGRRDGKAARKACGA